MKIDLHCHTKATKAGDPATRNVTIEKFKEKVLEANVSIVAITNHNFFNFEEYLNFKNAVKKYCDVWPGIELDVKQREGKHGHLIVISDPALVEIFNNNVIELTGDSNPNDFSISIEDVLKFFEPCNAVFIPHWKKNHSLSDENIEYLESHLENPRFLIKESGNLTSVGVLSSRGEYGIIGSDVRDWDKYESSNFAYLKYDFKGYGNFLKLLNKDVPFIQSLIDNSSFVGDETVYGNSDKNANPFNIKIYSDVNIIFGDKGSGKSEILKSLRKVYELKKEKVAFFEGGKNEQWFTDLMKIDKASLDCRKYDQGMDNYESVFVNLINFVDESPTKFQDYINFFRSKNRNVKASTIKIKDQTIFNARDTKEFETLNNETLEIIKFIDKFRNFKIYSKYEKAGDLVKALIDVASFSAKEAVACWNQIISEKLANFTIEDIANIVSRETGTPSEPHTCGLDRFWNKRRNAFLSLSQISNSLKLPPKNNSSFVGDIGNKGKGYLVTSVGFVNLDNIGKLNRKQYNKTKEGLSAVLRDIKNSQKAILSNDFPENVKQLSNDLKDYSIKSLNDFVFETKEFRLNNQSSYTPSKGETAILSMQYNLLNNSDCDVYLIDEPELNLGSFYIEETIIPLIKDLAHKQHIVVIATHDANIAVRTFPATSILKIVDNNEYKTYQGSMFTGQLINIENHEDIKDWRIESQQFLEGGKNAFDERGWIYE